MSEKTSIQQARAIRGSFNREYECEDKGIFVTAVLGEDRQYCLRVSVPAGQRVNLPSRYQGLKVEISEV